MRRWGGTVGGTQQDKAGDNHRLPSGIMGQGHAGSWGATPLRAEQGPLPCGYFSPAFLSRARAAMDACFTEWPVCRKQALGTAGT